ETNRPRMIKDWDYEPDDYLLLMKDFLRGNINAHTYARKLFSTNSKRSISSEASSIIIQKAYSEADAYNPNIRLDYTITERQLRRSVEGSAKQLESRISLERSVGQLLIVGFDGAEMTPRLAELLTRVQPAGVILFARNIVNAQQTHKLLKDCQACVREPLFTCVDLEGGKVDRFRSVTGPAPSAADAFSTGDRKLFRKHG